MFCIFFTDTIRTVNARGLALLVPRNIENFPGNKERLTGTIDVWWIVRILSELNQILHIIGDL